MDGSRDDDDDLMDPVFVALVAVFALVLVAVYLLNGLPDRTGDLSAVLAALRRRRPDTVAFTLGRDQSDGRLYRNVYAGAEGAPPYVLSENDPVASDGGYVTVDTGHGRVIDGVNGFTVTGVAGAFTCPEGYEGSRCRPKPLCPPADDGRAKPLTREQFNALELYGLNVTPVSDRVDATAADYHPRVSVQCTTDGAYELRVCPDNRLLDPSTLSCVEYDVCQDRVNGYKHDYRIDSYRLKHGEYYLCADNRSELKSCDGNAAFSTRRQACVSESECVGRGKSQLPVDDHNYVQCRGDNGRDVHCEHGVQRRDGVLSCVTKTCRPYTLSHDDGILRYAYGRNVCDDQDRATLTVCEQAPSTYHTATYRWADAVDLKLHNWPQEVMDATTGECGMPGVGIILESATIDLRWSPAMLDAHKFNVRKLQYVCDPSVHNYRWDYINGVVVPAVPPTLFVDAATPCQSSAVNVSETEWWTLATSLGTTVETFPPHVTPPLVYAVPLPPRYLNRRGRHHHHHFWPVYDRKRDRYKGSVLTYDRVRNIHTATEYTSKIPPCGFKPVVQTSAEVPAQPSTTPSPPSERNDDDDDNTSDTDRTRIMSLRERLRQTLLRNTRSTRDDEKTTTVSLELIGYTGFPYNEIVKPNARVYYFVATGVTERLRFDAQAKTVSHEF